MSAPSRSVAGYGPTGADVLAAGAVLWRPAGPDVEVALVHRPRYDDWSFPKGKLDTGETMAAAAAREVGEETGFACRLGHLLGEVRYAVDDGHKLVRYWCAQALDGTFTPGAETDELRWLHPADAAALLSYAHDVEVLHRFTTIGLPTGTLVLVRHAKAGSRSQWDGDDDLRPLSGAGREQVDRLTDLLRLFGPDRIVTAPPVRCRETVAPLAELLGLPLAVEPLLSEVAYWIDPPAGLARLRELGAEPGVTVACSQGGVIPDAIGQLASASTARLDVDPDDVPARKGSTWVLGLRDGEVITADYYDRPSG
jgi:8-oxo-dGTP pyrophosphatase MutT (NUDIX family)/phosphohistidine phosphatase SixA